MRYIALSLLGGYIGFLTSKITDGFNINFLIYGGIWIILLTFYLWADNKEFMSWYMQKKIIIADNNEIRTKIKIEFEYNENDYTLEQYIDKITDGIVRGLNDYYYFKNIEIK